MPVVNGRLTCCSCGSDLGDADDPYRDPACGECLNRENEAELESEEQDLAACVVCGGNKRVCCDDGYIDNEDGTVTHSDPVCVDCCGPHPHYGAGYERADCDQ